MPDGCGGHNFHPRVGSTKTSGPAHLRCSCFCPRGFFPKLRAMATAAAAAKAAKDVISRVKVRGTGAAAATKAARSLPRRRIHSSSDKVSSFPPLQAKPKGLQFVGRFRRLPVASGGLLGLGGMGSGDSGVRCIYSVFLVYI